MWCRNRSCLFSNLFYRNENSEISRPTCIKAKLFGAEKYRALKSNKSKPVCTTSDTALLDLLGTAEVYFIRFSIQVYTKPSHLQVLLDFNSAHSYSLKCNVNLSQLIRL
jgi:hypothetical protein